MELLIWRHAEAGEHRCDFNRHLTKKGLQQAEKMAKWIKKYYPSEYTLWVSEALRTQETANFLKHKMIIKSSLNPLASTSIIINEILKHIVKKNLLLVGHQPWVGELAAYLICHTKSPQDKRKFTYCSFKKCNIWWLEIQQQDQLQFYTKVKAVLSPNLVD